MSLSQKEEKRMVVGRPSIRASMLEMNETDLIDLEKALSSYGHGLDWDLIEQPDSGWSLFIWLDTNNLKKVKKWMADHRKLFICYC